MIKTSTKGLGLVVSVIMVLAGAGCVPGVTHNTVIYDKGTKWTWVDSIAPSDDPTNRVPCNGSVEVYRQHGTLHLFSPEGPWWGRRSFYGFYFKEGSDAPGEFYLKASPDRQPIQTGEVTGKVILEGRRVIIDVRYKDANGHWQKLPINGHHKIDRVFPDDRAAPKQRPCTQ